MPAELDSEIPSVSAAALGRSWWQRYRWKILPSLVLGGAFVWLLRAGALPLWPSEEALAAVKWWGVVGYALTWSLVHLVRAGRWHWLVMPLGDVPLRRVLNIGFVGLAAILLLPLRTGEFVRPVMLHRASRISGWAATGTIGAERIIDGLTLSVILFAALQFAKPLDPLPDHIGELPVPAAIVPAATYSALALFASAFVVMGIFYWRRAWARAVTERVLGIVSVRFATWLAQRVEQVADGLGFLPQWRFSGPFLLGTIVYWLGNALAAWLLAWSCGFEDITFAQSCVTLGVLALGILVPSAPGFFGTFQISIYAGLALYFAPERVVGAGAAYVLIMYLVQVGLVVLSALFGLLGERAALVAERAAPKLA